MNELIASDVNAHMGNTGLIGVLEENQITGL